MQACLFLPLVDRSALIVNLAGRNCGNSFDVFLVFADCSFR